jgi:hypothetical protein
MAARRSFWNYIKAAFHAKPGGMFVAPNWIGLAGFGILGFLNPGFWLIGAGVELSYLLACASSRRFRRVVDATAANMEGREHRGEIARTLGGLSAEDRQHYARLVGKCREILRSLSPEATDSAADQARGLAHLVWIFLSLQSTRNAMRRHLEATEREEAEQGTLTSRMEELDAQLKSGGQTEELRKSLERRREILLQRVERRRESVEKLAFTDAELRRIEEQVDLMRDQAALQSDPSAVSGSIDRVSGDLQEAASWLREQRRIYRELGDVIEEPPPASIFASE